MCDVTLSSPINEMICHIYINTGTFMTPILKALRRCIEQINENVIICLYNTIYSLFYLNKQIYANMFSLRWIQKP